MLIVLSPAKSLDYETPVTCETATQPLFVEQAAVLVDILRKKSPSDLATLMSISDKLSVLNAVRYQEWSKVFHAGNARQAVLAFNGDVYDGLSASTLSPEDLAFAQRHLRILSGLYGVLRPLDLMQPYRLEMGTKLPNPMGKDLYAYWKPVVASTLNADLHSDRPVLVNLASDEYFKSVDLKVLKGRVVQPVFQDFKSGQYKVISFFAKKARGLMARYIIEHRLSEVDDLKSFSAGGYRFEPSGSTDSVWLFRRKEA